MNFDQPPIEDRRDPDAPVTRSDLAGVQRQLSTGDLRMTAIEAELRINTSVTADVKALLDAARVGLKVIGWLGTAAIWIGKIGAAIGTMYGVYQLIRHGSPPPK